MKLMSKKNMKNESGAKNTQAPVSEQQDTKSVHVPGANKNRR